MGFSSYSEFFEEISQNFLITVYRRTHHAPLQTLCSVFLAERNYSPAEKMTKREPLLIPPKITNGLDNLGILNLILGYCHDSFYVNVVERAMIWLKCFMNKHVKADYAKEHFCNTCKQWASNLQDYLSSDQKPGDINMEIVDELLPQFDDHLHLWCVQGYWELCRRIRIVRRLRDCYEEHDHNADHYT